ncbi:MAG: hypothetical protein IAI49_14770 [Candidatus Eremiobacteraeota bacterium]|nr:hypothetical protein [Candidatus Eremiobacteraeota bacterium]
MHATDSLAPSTAQTPHDGYWTFELDDGTFFHVIRCSHAGTMRLHLANHAPAASVLPSARSQKQVSGTALASLTKHLGAAPATTYAALEAMFARHGDPMLDPDSAT